MLDSLDAHRIRTRRQQILDAAIEVIAARGFQRTTIRQIAQAAGVADGTIYNYFANKEALLLGIIERLTEAETRELHFAAAAQRDFTAFVAEYVAHRMQEIAASANAFRAILPETLVNAELSRQVNAQIYAPAFAVAERYLQELMAQGVVADVDPAVAARLFASPVLGLFLLRLLGDEHVIAHWDVYAAELSRLLVQGLRPAPTAAGDELN